jgi:hypothetical protein
VQQPIGDVPRASEANDTWQMQDDAPSYGVI